MPMHKNHSYVTSHAIYDVYNKDYHPAHASIQHGYGFPTEAECVQKYAENLMESNMQPVSQSVIDFCGLNTY